MLCHQSDEGIGINTAQRHQLPEQVSNQRNGAADNKDAAQLANITVHIAHDARHAAVKTEGGENNRDGRKRQTFLQREGEQVNLVNMRCQQHQHHNQEENFGAEQKRLNRSTSDVPAQTTPPPISVKTMAPVSGESDAPKPSLILDAISSPAPLM